MVTGVGRLGVRGVVRNENGEPVDWALGEDYGACTTAALCRCGRSATKPFCDGSHAEAGFDGTLTADRGSREAREKVYEGVGITMTDDESLCASYGFCLPNRGVWKQIRETGDPIVRERVKRQILLCPTGRLEFSATPGGEPVEYEYEPQLAVVPDGALWVLGGIEIVTEEGFAYERRNRVCLCRCGESENKPFCDGTHAKAGFTDDRP